MSGDRGRLLIVAILLAGTALFLQSRGTREIIPKSTPLALLPAEIGDWQSVERPVSSEVRAILGPGDYEDRLYTRNPGEPSVDLFIGYFASQRTGNTIHSPKHCLPGAGWKFTTSQQIWVPVPGAKPLRVNQAILGKGPEKMLAIYWYQAHGRTVASEYWAKFYLVLDAIKMNRTDGSLVRFLTPIAPGENSADACNRLISLISGLAPQLGNYIPN